jgi:hypothetical protein
LLNLEDKDQMEQNTIEGKLLPEQVTGLHINTRKRGHIIHASCDCSYTAGSSSAVSYANVAS